MRGAEVLPSRRTGSRGTPIPTSVSGQTGTHSMPELRRLIRAPSRLCRPSQRTFSPRRQLLIPIRIQAFGERAGTLAGESRRPRDTPSLPFDRRGGFGGDIVNHAVDAPDLIDNAGRDAGQESVRNSGP